MTISGLERRDAEMRGQIMIETATGRPWLYVREASIQIQVLVLGGGKLLVNAFRTDGYYEVRSKRIPIERWLRQTHQFTTKLEVPEHIVAFAVKNEQERQDSVSDIENILRHALKQRSQRGELKDFQALLKLERRESDEETEQRIGQEIQKLMAEARGLQ